jgi:hypothetical protein
MKLQILDYLPIDKKYHKIVSCKCYCGKEFITRLARVQSGQTKSCGCIRIIHGDSKRGKETVEYNTWLNMKKRCYAKSHESYKYYGGRGIKVCKRWLESYQDFILDMGYKPSKKHSIDRINNDGNYTPSNCRWATQLQQVHNRRI